MKQKIKICTVDTINNISNNNDIDDELNKSVPLSSIVTDIMPTNMLSSLITKTTTPDKKLISIENTEKSKDLENTNIKKQEIYNNTDNNIKQIDTKNKNEVINKNEYTTKMTNTNEQETESHISIATTDLVQQKRTKLNVCTETSFEHTLIDKDKDVIKYKNLKIGKDSPKNDNQNINEPNTSITQDQTKHYTEAVDTDKKHFDELYKWVDKIVEETNENKQKK